MYKFFKEGMTCKPDELYTYVRSTVGSDEECDGWNGLSWEECQMKCTNNELPSGSCAAGGAVCNYISYTHGGGWCHLAETCTPTADYRVALYRKELHWIHQHMKGK